jgi:hypothetical protein
MSGHKVMAIGGPAEDIGPRFTVETLAEGCSGGLRWAATRMQGHRPHQVSIFLAADVNAMR